MSQYVQRATGMATKAMEVAKTRVLPPAVEYYNATMAKNAQYVVKDPEAVDKLGRQLVFSNLAKCVQPARAPPPHDPRARAITLGRTPARAGNREPRAHGDDARHPVWTRSCLTAATPPPRFLPTAFRLPAMVEGAQGEIKVVQQKWANRMELPMTEVRLMPPPPLSPRAIARRRDAHFFPARGPAPFGDPSTPDDDLSARAIDPLSGCFRTDALLFSFPSFVSQVGVAALFAGEVYAWFCVGEVIGRGGSLTGY